MAGTNRARAHKRTKRRAQDYSDILSRCGGAMSEHGLQVNINKLPEVLTLALEGCDAATLAKIQDLVMANPAGYRQLREMGIPQQPHPVMSPRAAQQTPAPPQGAQGTQEATFAGAPGSGLVFGTDGEEYEDLVLGGASEPVRAQRTDQDTPTHGTKAERRGAPRMSLQEKLQARLSNTDGVEARRGPDGVIRSLRVSADQPEPAPRDDAQEQGSEEQRHAHELAIAQRLALRNRAGQPKPR